MIKEGMYPNMSNEDYHLLRPVGEHFYSSSQLKDMLEDPAVFKEKYITRTLSKRESNSAFDIGNYYHTAILEPHLLPSQYIVWPGEAKRGKAYADFVAKHPKKTILSSSQYIEAENVVQATLASDICMSLIDDPLATTEESFFIIWNGVKCKVRTDILRLGPDESYIVDLKSTTGNVRSDKKMRVKTHSLDYELSAAFYILIVNEYIRRWRLEVAPVTKWYWIFASKDTAQAQVWQASKDMLEVGRQKALRALALIQENEATEWQMPEKILSLDAYGAEKAEWIPAKPAPAKKLFGAREKLQIGN